jgi:hypothetical protein
MALGNPFLSWMRLLDVPDAFDSNDMLSIDTGQWS